jgi:hypothetical protein
MAYEKALNGLENDQMIIQTSDGLLIINLPASCLTLHPDGLAVHPAISQITLHGSRGLGGTPRPDSDLDLSLIYNPPEPPVIDETLGMLFHEILHTTLDSWRGEVELDLAVIFPLRACGLVCFQVTHYDPSGCPQGGVDCFGIYKIQKGFSGFVLNAGIQVERMYPCITIWSKPGS